MRVSQLVAGAVSVLAVVATFGHEPAAFSHAQAPAITIEPRVAPVGAPVVLAGFGCDTPVTVRVRAFLFPGEPTIVLDTDVLPDSAGGWTTGFAMPETPAYVEVTCDGATAIPVAIAPADGRLSAMAPAAITEREVIITTSPLVDGSELAVFTPAGALVGSATVVGGTGTVRVPRALGPGTVIVTAMRARDPGIDLPYVPIGASLQLPFAQSPTVAVDPQVAPSGATVVASGVGCPGRLSLRVTGQPSGWYDIPDLHLERIIDVGPSGSWSVSFAMPSDPSDVRVTCTLGDFSEFASTRIAPTDQSAVPATAVADGGDWLVTAPNCFCADVAVFTTDGARVNAVWEPALAVVRISGSPGPVLLLGVESLGENAEALQTSRPQLWSVQLGSTSSTTTSASTAPTAWSTDVGTAGTSTTVSRGTSSPIGRLPNTGYDARTVGAATVVLVFGAVLAFVARRPDPRR